jgi:endonuclease-3
VHDLGDLLAPIKHPTENRKKKQVLVYDVPMAMDATTKERKARARKVVAYLKKTYPKPKTELNYETPFQFVVAVMLSAQCTDKKVNQCTESLFLHYRTASDFARTSPKTLAQAIKSITFFNAKARHIVAMAQVVDNQYRGHVPNTAAELVALPGIGYKTAHVILGELYDMWEGIPTDTHVRRFALRFDLTDNTELTKISKDLEALVPKADWKYVNNGLVLYGRYVCKAHTHDCSEHPLTKLWPPAGDIWPRAR